MAHSRSRRSCYSRRAGGERYSSGAGAEQAGAGGSSNDERVDARHATALAEPRDVPGLDGPAGARAEVPALRRGGAVVAWPGRRGRELFRTTPQAVFDRIRTHENHRRMGLARALMATLGNIALGNGVTRAGLVATPDGRLLYEALGWQLHSLYTTALIPGPPAAASG